MNLQPRLRIGNLAVDMVSFEQALDRIVAMREAGRGGAVFTANVDHTVLANDEPLFRAAYERVALAVADGMPLVWLSRLLGHQLPERVAGSDLVMPLLGRAATRQWNVYLLGASEGVAARAAAVARQRFPGLRNVAFDSPHIDLAVPASQRAPVIERIRVAGPDVVFVALGSPKQEIWIDEVTAALRPAVLLGVGASLDLIAGNVPRAPRWMSEHGLEWFYRFLREPRRLWRRYFLRDPRFVGVVAASLRRPPGERITRGICADDGSFDSQPGCEREPTTKDTKSTKDKP
jgi:N-acetylglucosaminyldiphosphoundecaprenol N-acetyl-beta-D-mannosaminyltransferase